MTGGNKSLALTREVNLDMLSVSSDSSEEENRDNGFCGISSISFNFKQIIFIAEFGA